MLSGESAAGAYPIEAVETMSKIAVAAEQTIDYEKRYQNTYLAILLLPRLLLLILSLQTASRNSAVLILQMDSDSHILWARMT